MLICKKCGNSHENSKIHLLVGHKRYEPWCSYCVKPHITVCFGCKQECSTSSTTSVDWLPKESLSKRDTLRPKKIKLCYECAAMYWSGCRACNCFLKIEDMIEVGKATYCPYCITKYTPCAGCGNSYDRDSLADGLCETCLKSMIKEYNCRVDKVIDNWKQTDEKAKFYHRCIPSKFSKKSKENHGGAIRYFGIELEVEVDPSYGLSRHRAAKRVYDCFDNFVFIKRDGSLRDEHGNENGFEIVSVAATIEKHRKAWDKFFYTYQEKGLLKSFFSKNCGLHVHISKDSMSRLQIGKFLRFICSQKNRKFIHCVAERESNQYCNYTIEKRVSQVPFIYKGKRFNPNWIGNEGHHTAVNLQNTATVELRIFKGTLRKQSFFKSLEFCQALVEFCNVASIRDVETHEAFCSWLEKEYKEYPNLYDFLVVKNYVKPLKKKEIKRKKRGKKRVKILPSDGIEKIPKGVLVNPSSPPTGYDLPLS